MNNSNNDKTNWCQSVAGIVMRDKMVLLTRHTYGAGKGKLIIPGGYVDWNETPQDAVRREVMEETGVQAEPTDIIGIRFNLKDWYVIFMMNYIGGTPRSDGNENNEVIFMDIEEAITRDDVAELTKKLLAGVKNKENALKKIDYQGNSSKGPYSLYRVDEI